MVGKRNVTCAKCGISSKDNPGLSFHRFPLPSVHGPLKAKVWAKFCFPNEDWSTDQSLNKLYKQNKVLCAKHFDDSAYTTEERLRLNKFAIPYEARNILAQVREEMNNQPLNVQDIDLDPEVQASTSQCTVSTEESNNENILQSMSKKPRKGIMEEIGAKSLAELTPRKKKMYKQCRKNLSEILRLRRKLKSMKKCKRNILDALHSDEAVNEMIQRQMTSPFYLLLQSQLKNTPRKLSGRRWTLDDKVLALSLYKKSSSCYRLLRRLFCLPSVSSLKALLNKIPLECGINSQIINTIKDITQKRPVQENLCMLAFDEMSIRKNLSLNTRQDQIDGYQDHAGQGRTSEIASKALTFMAIGVRKKWKQPIAFYFSGANVTADRLSALIKEVLGACFEAGLEVIGTVCDCDGVNLRALNTLGSSTEKPYFDYEGHEIVTVLDPPHLLKCFRNNFMKYDIEFIEDLQINNQKSKGIASWSHIDQSHNLEKNNPNFVFAPALTQQHLQPNGKQKMKVRLAAQVLSHSVAAGLYAKVAQNELPQNAASTATVVSNMDQLFDAVNGDTPDRKRGKPFLTNMSSTSPHSEIFEKMKKFFKEMKFLGAKSRPPSQDGWLRTLCAIEIIYKNLKTYNVKTLSPRRLNQDPLENCFGCIRNNCGSNPNPTSVQFVAALKTSITTNLINNNRNRNCADDQNSMLSNFKTFLSQKKEPETGKSEESSSSIDDGTSSFPVGDFEPLENLDSIPQCSGEMQACAYVCGFIVKMLDLNCDLCKKIFLSDPNTEVCHIFTSFKEYRTEKCSLKYTQPEFVKFVEKAASLINDFLEKKSHEKNIKMKLFELCETIPTNCLKGWEIHDNGNVKKIIKATIIICIKRFCVKTNRRFLEKKNKAIFSEKNKNFKKFLINMFVLFMIS